MSILNNLLSHADTAVIVSIILTALALAYKLFLCPSRPFEV